MRSSLQTLGSAALGVGIGLAILGAGFLVSNLALAGSATTAGATASPPATAVPPSSAAQTQSPPTVAPSVAPTTKTPAPTATPTPTTTPDPLTVAAYQSQGLRLAALGMPAGYTLASPIAGQVEIVVYQFINGEVRSGADAAGVPNYPYVFIRSGDREIKLRPGALDKDVQLIVKDGDTIAAGAPIFKIIGTGPSSWAAFYDKNVTAQVIASVATRPQGTEVDPVPVFRR